MGLKRRQGKCPQIANSLNSNLFQPVFRYLADTGSSSHWERWQKVFDVFRLDHEKTIGLTPVGGDLRKELVRCYTSRCNKRKLFANLTTDGDRYLGRRWQAGFVFCHVKIGFVKRQRFDQIGMTLEDRPYCTRNSLVASKVRRDKDCPWAKPLRRYSRHCRTNPKPRCFVGSRTNDGSLSLPGHHDWLAAQRRIVALLDRRIKSVYVDMNDFAMRRRLRIQQIASHAFDYKRR